MSTIAALRSRRSLEDLPPLTSDDDLLAWSQALVVHERDDLADADAGSGSPPAPPAPRRRREPLRAADRASRDIRAARTDSFITAEEIFEEIRQRESARS